MTKFQDRREAGQLLAEHLQEYKGRTDVVVLGIPRGGVVVAAEVARTLGAPLDMLISHKIGAPGNEELAIGAVASDGTVNLDKSMVRYLHISERQVQEQCRIQLKEIRRRNELFHRNQPPLNVHNKTAIVVDDGIATGATVIAALRALKLKKPRRIVLAVPVAPGAMVKPLRAECDALVLLDAPEPFMAVGYFYEDFSQVTDEEVVALLGAPP